ncbi:hypothetical protein N7493_006595 [Penicillium malachiteum]|uniref:Uncharacterized protein n=1 Tax=Penicillium malachiteum TaxID=1324776 RepID=A0AAD6HKV9_9EURO|nr:hypothetical protein N7493_006595 [Penicillium malachiteum]
MRTRFNTSIELLTHDSELMAIRISAITYFPVYPLHLRTSFVTILLYITFYLPVSNTYDHRVWRTGLPVRSAVLKPHAGQLVE